MCVFLFLVLIFFQYILKNPDSLISRVYGLHSVEVHHGENVFVVVMENVFNTKNKIHERYDLKGSWVRREVGKAHMGKKMAGKKLMFR